MKNLTVWIAVLLPVAGYGAADSYRISWRSDPSTSMVVAWNQTSGENPEVLFDTVDHNRKADAYRNRQAPDRIVEYRGMTNHFVRLENLKPDTAYYFVVKDSEGAGDRLWFRTAPDKAKPFTFISGGDSRTKQEPRREGNKLVARLRPLFVLFGGDYTNIGKPAEWKEWLDDWQLTISEDGRIYPIIATHGNHENADMQMMDKLFDTPNTNQYYSLGIAGDLMRIWVLNSELEYKDPSKVAGQQEWIEKDLPAHPDVQWKIAAYHRPMRPHTASKSEGLGRIAAWAQLFHDNGVDVVIESDTHMVKRSYPVRPDSSGESYESFIRDDENGLVFIGEGSWGAPIRPPNDDKPWTMASDSFYQFKWIQVYPDEMLIRSVKFENTDSVVPLTEENLFEEPENMVFWTPETGKILRLPFSAKHPTFHEPKAPRILFGMGEKWEWSVDGTNWVKGVAPLGFGDRKVKTKVLETVEDKPVSVLFRKDFEVEDPDQVSRLFFNMRVDDGCMIKLNGELAARHNMQSKKSKADTRATEQIEGASEEKTILMPVDLKYLKAGKNRIEVRVHQAAGSSDLVFDLGITIKDKPQPADL